MVAVVGKTRARIIRRLPDSRNNTLYKKNRKSLPVPDLCREPRACNGTTKRQWRSSYHEHQQHFSANPSPRCPALVPQKKQGAPLLQY